MIGKRHGFWLLAVLAAATPLQAQDEEPAEAVAVLRAAELDDMEPAVSSAALAGTARPDSATTGAGKVMDRLDLDRTEVTGNQELPKVLYIVPWQKSDPGDLTGRPVNSLLDEVLAPIDRQEFIREVDYYSDLHDAAGKEE